MRYAKLKGVEKHLRKLPKKNMFKTVIARFERTGSVKADVPVKEKLTGRLGLAW